MAKVPQYQLTIKWGTKLITGLETTGLKIKPNHEDVLLKANAGNPTKEFVDFDTTMSIAGKTYGVEANEENFETLRQAAAIGAQVAFIYGRFTQGNQQVSGYCIMTDWSEDAGSEKKAGSWSGNIEAIKGSVSFGNQA
jgi:hypothetical protein